MVDVCIVKVWFGSGCGLVDSWLMFGWNLVDNLVGVRLRTRLNLDDVCFGTCLRSGWGVVGI